MEKKISNPWKWQDQLSFVQAVEVTQIQGTLYVSGQTAISADGQSSTGDMKTQLTGAIQNLEQVIREAGYDCKNIVHLKIYTISTADFWPQFPILQEWIAKNDIKLTMTLLEVKGLFETLTVELEATVVR